MSWWIDESMNWLQLLCDESLENEKRINALNKRIEELKMKSSFIPGLLLFLLLLLLSSSSSSSSWSQDNGTQGAPDAMHMAPYKLTVIIISSSTSTIIIITIIIMIIIL